VAVDVIGNVIEPMIVAALGNGNDIVYRLARSCCAIPNACSSAFLFAFQSVGGVVRLGKGGLGLPCSLALRRLLGVATRACACAHERSCPALGKRARDEVRAR
jgi:hypothetical protein